MIGGFWVSLGKSQRKGLTLWRKKQLASQAPVALFDERLPGHLDAKLILVVHDELVVECRLERIAHLR